MWHLKRSHASPKATCASAERSSCAAPKAAAKSPVCLRMAALHIIHTVPSTGLTCWSEAPRSRGNIPKQSRETTSPHHHRNSSGHGRLMAVYECYRRTCVAQVHERHSRTARLLAVRDVSNASACTDGFQIEYTPLSLRSCISARKAVDEARGARHD